MIAVSAEKHVPGTPEAVFDFMNRPANHAAITPSLAESREIDRMDNGGAKATYVYRIAGIPFRGTVEAREFVPGERIVLDMKGDLEGTIRLGFTEEEGGTRVTYAADYDMPGSRLAKAARPLAEAVNARVLRQTLANLRDEFAD